MYLMMSGDKCRELPKDAHAIGVFGIRGIWHDDGFGSDAHSGQHETLQANITLQVLNLRNNGKSAAGAKDLREPSKVDTVL